MGAKALLHGGSRYFWGLQQVILKKYRNLQLLRLVVYVAMCYWQKHATMSLCQPLQSSSAQIAAESVANLALC